jgi:hypothetical protein
MATKRDEQAADYRAEAIARPFAEAAECSVTASKTAEPQSGMRTERVVIEIEHSGPEPINLDDLGLHLRTRLGLFVGLRRINESVRVVEEPKLAPDANDDGGSNHAAQAASGGGEQLRGWLTEDDRLALDAARTIIDGSGRTNIGATIDALLARSSPPEVVLPDWVKMCVSHGRQNQLLRALAAAGVAVKEVGRE